MHGLLPSPVYGRGWPKGRERAYGVMNYGSLNIIKSHSHRILVDTGLTAGRYTKNFRSQSFRNYEDYH